MIVKLQKKKIIGLLTLIIMTIQLFSPYGILIGNVNASSYTTVPNEDGKFMIIKLMYDENDRLMKQDWEYDRVVQMNLILVGDIPASGYDIALNYDKSKLQPAYYDRSVRGYVETNTMFEWAPMTKIFGSSIDERNSWLDTTAGTIRMEGVVASDTNPKSQSGGQIVLAEMFFKVKEDYEIADLTDDMFSLRKADGVDYSGIEIAYNEALYGENEPSIFGLTGFSQEERKITSIVQKTAPNKTTYEHGEEINLEGGYITVTYSDGKSKDIPMTDSNIKKDKEKADANDKKVVIVYKNDEEHSVEIPLEVTDPISSLDITSPMEKLEYSHDETLNFDSLQLTATTKSGNKINLTKDSQGVTISEVKANVNSSNFRQTSAEGVVPLKGTQDIVFTYEGKTATQTIIVNDVITGINVKKQPNKTIYKYDENLDLTGAVVELTLGSGTADINLPNGSIVVSNYNPKTIGQQNLIVSLGDKNATNTIDVEVYNYVESSTLTPPYETIIEYDKDLDLDGGKLNLQWKDGSTSNVELKDTNISGFNKKVVGTQTITATYIVTYTLSDTTKTEEITKTFLVKVENAVIGVIVTAPTEKQEYQYGNSLNLEGATITLNYADTTTTQVTPDETMVFEKDTDDIVKMNPTSGYGEDNKLTKTVTLKYTYGSGESAITGSKDFDITIINTVKEAVLHGTPKPKYNVNDPMDENLEILVTREVGTPTPVKVTAGMISNFSTATETTNETNGTRTAVITYKENGITKTIDYTYRVVDTVKSISIDTAPAEAQKYGEELDLTGATIEVEKGSETKSIPLTKGMIKEGTYNPETLGEQIVTIEYGEDAEGNPVTATFKVVVKDYVKEIKVNPESITGKYNDELSKLITDNEIKYTITYAKKDPVEKTLEATMIPDYNKESVDTQNLEVKYTDNDADSYTNGEEFKADISIKLQNPVKSISITAPSKTEYKHGESLATNGTIIVTYANDGTDARDMTKEMIFEEDGTTPATTTATSYDETTHKAQKTLKITYGEDEITETIEYPITIINAMTEAKLHGTPKTKYNVGDSIDENLEILVTREEGTPTPVKVTSGMISNFNTTEEGTRTAVITYKENGVTKTIDYTYIVVDMVKSINIDTAPEEAQKYGEELDLTGATIEVEKGSETKSIPLTKEMIKEGTYNPETIGEQIVTIEYGEDAEGNPVTATFKVVVKDYVKEIKVNPESITGKYNDELSKLITDNEIKYTITYAKKDPVEKTLEVTMVEGYNKESVDTQNLKVKYTDNDADSYTNGEIFKADLTIKLEDPVQSISITKDPSNTDYGYNEALDLTGGIINVTRLSGNKDIKMTDEGVTLTEVGGDPLDLTNVTFGADHKATKTIQVNYGDKSDTFDIIVTNKITGIKMKDTPKTEYKVNDTLDLNTEAGTIGTIEVTRQDNLAETIDLDNANVVVSNFDSTEENKNLSIKVEYTENGITKETNYIVKVIDNVKDVVIETIPKTTYKYGESLDVTTGTLIVTKDSGTKTIPMTKDMITELDGTAFNSKKLGTRNLQVTYGGITKEYEIIVSDYVKDVILTPPSKVKYEYGENLKLDGGSVQEVMASGTATSPVALTDSRITLSTFNPNSEGAQTIYVSLDGKQIGSFGLIVEDNVQSIVMKDTPKTKYKYGEALDIKGGTILATKTSTKTETINISSSMVSGYNPNKLGEQKLIVTYKGKTTNYSVNVEDYVADIKIIKPKKLVYKLNEKLDLKEGMVQKVMASGTATSPVAMTQAMIKGFDSSTEGAKLISVTYGGITKTFGITVVDKLSDVIIKTMPDKLDYLYGESFDVKGATLEVTKESGSKSTIKVTEDMISGYNAKKLGEQKLTITYEGFENEFYVNVEDYVSKLKVEKPTKTEYEYGQALDLQGGKVSVIMASGKVDEIVQMTASMISEFDSKQLGKQTIKVEYKSLQGEFQVNVVDKVKGISINTEPDKVKYEYGEKLDLTGATISVVKSSGITTIPITKKMVSGYDAKKPGTQVIKVTYQGFETKFIVIVNEKKEEPQKPEKPEGPENPQKPEDPTKPQKPQQPSKPQKPEDPVKPQQPEQTKPTKPVTPQETQKEDIKLDDIQIIEKDNTEEKEMQNNKTEDKKENKPVEEQTPDEIKEKPTETLGVKDDRGEDDMDTSKIVALIVGSISALILFIVIFFKRNVKIYVEENQEFVFGGLDKIKSKNPKIDIDKYLDGETYSNKVKIILSDSISNKLDGKEIEIKHRKVKTKYTIKYNNEPYEIILK